MAAPASGRSRAGRRGRTWRGVYPVDTATGRERLTDMRAELQDSIRVLRDEHA